MHHPTLSATNYLHEPPKRFKEPFLRLVDRKIPAKRHRKTGNTPSLTGFHHSPISYPECLHGEITRRVFFVATLSIRSSTNFKSCVSRWTDSNRQSYSYKESALPLCYIGLSVTSQRKEVLMKPKKKERHGLRFMDRILQSTVNSATVSP